MISADVAIKLSFRFHIVVAFINFSSIKRWNALKQDKHLGQLKIPRKSNWSRFVRFRPGDDWKICSLNWVSHVADARYQIHKYVRAWQTIYYINMCKARFLRFPSAKRNSVVIYAKTKESRGGTAEAHIVTFIFCLTFGKEERRVTCLESNSKWNSQPRF